MRLEYACIHQHHSLTNVTASAVCMLLMCLKVTTFVAIVQFIASACQLCCWSSCMCFVIFACLFVHCMFYGHRKCFWNSFLYQKLYFGVTQTFFIELFKLQTCLFAYVCVRTCVRWRKEEKKRA